MATARQARRNTNGSADWAEGADTIDWKRREYNSRYYKPTEKPPPITLPKLKFLEEKDDG